jgi:hypothetical protein
MTDPIALAIETARRLKGQLVTAESIAAAMRDINAEEAAPPDPYALGLAALRTARATPESRFEDTYKAARLAEFEAEHAAPVEGFRTATADDLAPYAAPDSYAAGLAALRKGVH